MENASKALIIAGAILISILIIGLGVFIYNMASSQIRKATLDTQAADTHNQPFSSYFGERQSATDVKNLATTIRSNNITGKTQGETQEIFILFKDAQGTITTPTVSTIQSTVASGKTYKINTPNDDAYDPVNNKDDAHNTEKSPAYYDNGYIRIIIITENPN